MNGTAIQQPVLTVDVNSVDRWRIVTLLTVAGVAGAGLLAVFGMPPVELHGPNHQLGLMMPTCGMTRAVAAAARLDLARAVAYNPASILLMVGAIGILFRAAVGTATGRWIDGRVGRPAIWWTVTTILFVGLWINQQAHAALLMGP